MTADDVDHLRLACRRMADTLKILLGMRVLPSAWQRRLEADLGEMLRALRGWKPEDTPEARP